MLLATWNVNSLKARLPRVQEFLAEHRPDVVFLQETKSPVGGFPAEDFRAAGYRAVDHSAGRWAGVALAARSDLALTGVLRGLPGEPDDGEARWIEADVGELRVISVYVPNGRAVGTPSFIAKLAFYEAMAARVAQLHAVGRRMVVAGDMNVMPTDLDLYDPAAFVGSTHVTPQERERYQAVLDQGLVDAFRLLHPDEPGFTWWDYRAGHFHKRLGLRIDHFLVSAELAPAVTRCGIDRSYRKGPRPSDHAPLLLELEGITPTPG